MTIFFKKTASWIVVIFLLSSFFRLSNLDLIEFKSDEALVVYQTTQFFQQPYLPQRGIISGTGVYNFPLFNYLVIILGIWSLDPRFLSGMIALINSLLIVAFFLLVKKYYGQLTAIFASILLASSPWAVLFSRKIWVQDLIFLFLLPYLYLFHELILKKNNKVILPLFVLLMLLIQLHGSGFFLFAVTVFILLILRIKINIKNAALGLLIGLIPSIPYIFFQITSFPSCPDCEAMIKYQQSFRAFDFNNLLRPFQIISGLGYHFTLGKSYGDFITMYPIVNILKYIFASGFLFILLGILFIIFKRKYLFILIYFVSVPFLYLITKTPAYMHYFVIIIPVSVLLFAISISSLLSLLQNKFFKMFIVTYFLLFIVANIIFTNSFYTFVKIKKHIEGDYGPMYFFTKSFIEVETNDYIYLPYINELKSYAYIYAQSKDFHIKMGEFFLDKKDKELAQKEFRKSSLNQN